jgi:anti-sigma factor RsiW
MSTTMNTTNEGERSEVEDLLPWHAAGTLGHRDMQRVEAALASDPELARRYELVREELSQTVYLNETLGAPSPRAMAALFAKIDAEPARQQAISINLGARIREFFADLSPRTLAWSASAAALAILLQAGLIAGIMLKEKSAGGYETASAPASVAGDGAYALIRFQPQANAAEIDNFLETNKLSIAGGPSAGGLYRVRIARTKLSGADRDRIVKTLQADKVVGFIATTE